MNQYVIVADWGSSHLRAYLCQQTPAGQLVLIESRFGKGVLKCDGQFEQELMQCIAPWQELFGKPPIVLAGQIGSSIGWQESCYLPCPFVPQDITNAQISLSVKGYNIAILPGISCQLTSNEFDVMRSEEIQILGWLQLSSSHLEGEYLLCLPGTHTKWVLVENGQVKLFKTAMTGELFELLSRHSLLLQPAIDGRTDNETDNGLGEEAAEHRQSDTTNIMSRVPTPDTSAITNQDGAFLKGASYAQRSDRHNFSHGIFSVRTQQIFNQLSSLEASAYLSGFLIGNDVKEAINTDDWNIRQFDKVQIIGEVELSCRFSTALSIQGIESECIDVEQCSLLGFSSVLPITPAIKAG